MKRFIALAIGFLSVLALSAATYVAKAETQTQTNYHIVQDTCTVNVVAIAEHNYNFVFEFNAIDEANFIYFGISQSAIVPVNSVDLKNPGSQALPDLAFLTNMYASEAEKPIDVRLDLWYQIQKSRFYQFQKYMNARRSLSLPPTMVC